ncbi:unnamed protein product [Brachionus calyciflorus]|uniref:Calpain catalytic domain-containing protein n=1 Tax=Brachionus calyciflorus TaxID=104777 RepID=A0A814HR70_9BILA|nr:unnamed protein product [Brachionus calyciflorus]
MENFSKIDIKNKISRNSYFYDNKIQYFKSQNYLKLRSECLKNSILFTDPLFEPNSKNLYVSRRGPQGIKWKRPFEICKSNGQIPKFIENTANANDLDQGYIGNCWFIAGCAAITFMPELFDKVVPKNQVCNGDGYCGIFHFRFWLYGIWYDVVVDDYLPVWEHNNQLVFCSNKEEPNEFWAALLEKAYAKICGSYENLEGGFTTDALIDMSGGLEESFSLDKGSLNQKYKDNLWKILVKSRELKSMNAAYLEPDPRVYEEKLPNGLVKGHAYTISKIALIEQNGKDVRLIRLRNPWGRIEWKGAWSDHSKEWNFLDKDLKNALEFKQENEGEFWMGFDDFLYFFDSIQFCHLTPESFSDEILNDFRNDKISWKMISYHDEWSLKKRSAGGSGNGGDRRFWTNPQFLIKLVDVDQEDNDNMATCIIALMQKYTREKRSLNGQSAEEFIQFRIFRVLNDSDAEKSMKLGEKLSDFQLQKVGNSGDYINKREVTKRFKLSPGYYIIIPSTFEANREGQFLLRIFTEKLIDDRNLNILEKENKITIQVNDKKPSNYFENPINLNTEFNSWSSLISGPEMNRRNVTVVRSNPENEQFSLTNNLMRPFMHMNLDDHDNITKKNYDTKSINKKKVQNACSLM